ncbi:hypothetical protein [Acinetobacter gerneri]|uniref:Uncharacterized protein n=1 Tax=Acinetobacter gerneri DSM 14967 = CIP 107464 = MTCC 9824 TaxID=1120926 RepID=N8ZR53_9GAMM|nr:hypothetical protein [Acinetobacter gerneri]ENV34228.1 hypothetical protein F960_01546 [Acinetobacter gerneri DSM 14967 = CIP 107464 = MTCC 9824]EPR84660.1 hypothetical protein L289_1211 [Acinetobacter gerneri DSM 14967 = CIP 107464 = MTCC 9824]MDV2440379.1 hypothetical protein [Acinetobacter gerneri]
MKLILVHGIWQNSPKDKLEKQWIAYLKTGFENQNLDSKILDGLEIDFVYYNDVRKKYKVSKVELLDNNLFNQAMDPITLTASELIYEFGEPEHIRMMEQSNLLPNKYTALKILAKIIDGSRASVPLARIFAEEVFLYRNNDNYRNEVNQRFLNCLGYPSVVLGHSLGSVVTFNSLTNQNLPINTYITLGSPLAGKTFHNLVKPLAKPKCCNQKWINIYHNNDPVYMKELKTMDDNIEITSDAQNPHGISTYLTHKKTAQVIYDALTQ